MSRRRGLWLLGIAALGSMFAGGCAKEDRVVQLGHAVNGVQTDLTFEKTAFSVGEPLAATIEIVAEVGSEPISLDHTGVHFRPVGTDGYAGAMFNGLESSMITRRLNDGRVVYTATLDLAESYPFVPRINTDYQVSVGCQVGYSGSRAVWANSPPVTIRVNLPPDHVLDYYLSELIADRSREISREMGDAFVPYPVDELLKIGKPALVELERLCRIERDRERLEKLIFPLRHFGGEGDAALERLSRDAEGHLKVLVGLELRSRNREGRQP